MSVLVPEKRRRSSEHLANVSSILYSVGQKPLEHWDKTIGFGFIKRAIDEEIESEVIDVEGVSPTSTHITCPKDGRESLDIELPILNLLVKSKKKYFAFEVHLLDHRNFTRCFRASNYQKRDVTRAKCTMPLRIHDGWNKITFNLDDFTKRAYGNHYVKTLKVQVDASILIRRIYFSDRPYSDEELPRDYRLYLPLKMDVEKKELEDEIKGKKKSIAFLDDRVKSISMNIESSQFSQSFAETANAMHI